MNPDELILTVGLPRSGKTTWATKHGAPVVNPDSIRMALHGRRFSEFAEPMVWAIAKIMVRSLFLAGHRTVILDATNNTEKLRVSWEEKDWTVRLEVFQTTMDECISRANAIGDAEIINVIRRMDKESDWRDK